jgi:phosphoribosylformylglycinamidine synthase PurS subunit
MPILTGKHEADEKHEKGGLDKRDLTEKNIDFLRRLRFLLPFKIPVLHQLHVFLSKFRGTRQAFVMIRAQVIVRPRASIFDPQGDAVCRAIQSLGLSVKQAHVGKCIELEIEGGDPGQARAQLETICRDLLSNPVIEDYVLTLQDEAAGGKKP